MKLHIKTDTTLVYIASEELARKIMQERYSSSSEVYIHIQRDTGWMILYENNDVNKVLNISMEIREKILRKAAADR